MKSRLALSAVLAIAVAALFSATRLVAGTASPAAVDRQSGLLLLPRATPAGQVSLYGHVKTMKRKGGRYEMGFDPAWFTSGLTASRAALEDTGSGDVPNDNYVIEEGHRLLTFVVPTNARVTVLTNGAKGLSATRIPVGELARIVNGGPHRKLYEPLDSGVWIRVKVDTVKTLDQQYRP
jgi:hypothetical protein